MSTCESLRFGQDLSCVNLDKKYYQQAVLVNRSDIDVKIVVTPSTDIFGVYTCRNRVFFNLKENKKGFRFTLGDNAASIFGSFDKSVIENVPQYNHNVSIVVGGVDEETMCLLTQLDYADYFAALKYYDGTVEIFGFDFGLTTQNYNYDPANNGGAVVIRLVSLPDAFEDNPPYIYKSTEGTEGADFDNNFEDVILDVNGDFNNDFNNDFYNEE